MEMNGIDLSRWNTITNYDMVAKNIDFAILKAGGSDAGFYIDSTFETKYNQLSKRYLPLGAYYFVGRNFYGMASGIADAKRFLNIIKGKKFEMPIYLDIETTSPDRKKEATDASIAFCEECEKAGYYVGIYASDISGFKDKLELDRLTAFDKWVARYGSTPKYVKKYGMWQGSSKGYIEGIHGNVDIDTAFYDYPSIIKKAHLNNL